MVPDCGETNSGVLRLMCVLAHPDDESLGMGGALARYASEGVQTYLVTATRGERGRCGNGRESPGLEVVGQIREAELRAAAAALGIREVNLLGFIDGDLDRVEPSEAIARIVRHLRWARPHVVLTFGPEGGYGHPDHIAVSQFTTAAVVCAADPSYSDSGAPDVHRVDKLYYMAWSSGKWDVYQEAFRTLGSNVDGVVRQATPWPDWAITTVIDTGDYWSRVWKAVSCHESQMGIYGRLKDLSPEQHQALWGSQEFYRVFSLVNGGRERETNLFEGFPNKPKCKWSGEEGGGEANA